MMETLGVGERLIDPYHIGSRTLSYARDHWHRHQPGRPDELLRLIGSLDQLTFSDEPPAVEILVVDNHPEQTARECLLSIDCAHPLRHRGRIESGRPMPAMLSSPTPRLRPTSLCLSMTIKP